MMASGMELGLDVQAAQDVHFVDHVECKIVSPDKEVISPIKGQVKGIFPSSPISNEIDSSEKEIDKTDPHKSKNSDSGLDSSNNSSDYGNEHFVERQERYTEEGELEKIVSPTKTEPCLFPDTGNASSQSLDAINNNEEVAAEDDANFNVKTNGKVAKDIYLGKEVSLHSSDNAKSQESPVKERHVSETSMNLYWYSGSLNVDLEELEAFKDSQNEPSASNVQITVNDDYYHSKTLDTENANTSENVFKSEANFDVKQSPIKRDCWSPAFESASSRILDLASELKSEPKNKKNQANENIRDSADNEKHPWGLDSESRVINESDVDNTDELPEIGLLTSADTSENIVKQEDMTVSQERLIDHKDELDAAGVMKWKSSETRYEDSIDAVGYMELKDKPPTPSKSTESKSESKKVKKDNVKKHTDGEDVADAVGYMEIKDKDAIIEQTITAADQNVLETSQTQMTTETKTIEQTKVADSTSLESQIIGGLSQTEDSKKVGLDVPDAKMTIEKVEVQPVQSAVVKHTEKAASKIKFEPFTMKRTYLIDEKSENILESNGGLFIDTETIIDEYLDDKNYTLTLNDCLLRLRNKKFEMKINSAYGYDPNRTLVAEMISNENEIIEVLMKMYKKKLEQKRRVSERQLDVLIDALNIIEFVTFETTRKRYQINDFIVTLDLTNFGFQVGEIEVVANSAKEMTEGLKKMDALATKLGLRPLQSN